MGGNLLGFTLASTAEQKLIDAAVCFQAPMKFGEVMNNVGSSMGGLYNFFLGNNAKQQLIRYAKDESLV